MKVFIVKPNERGYIKEIENTCESFQKEVDGYIEICYLDDGILAVVNEEGRIKDLPDCAMIPHYGVIKGNIVFVRDDGCGDFKSLTDEDVEVLKHWY